MSDICTLLYEMSENVSVSFCHGWLESLHRSFTWTQRLLFWNAKKSKTQHKELPHICNIGLFYTCMHTRYDLHCWQLNNRQMTSVGFYICTHTYRKTQSGVLNSWQKKRPQMPPNTTLRTCERVVRTMVQWAVPDHNNLRRGTDAVHDCNKLLIISDQPSMNWNNLFLALRPSSYDAHGNARLICY